MIAKEKFLNKNTKHARKKKRNWSFLPDGMFQMKNNQQWKSESRHMLKGEREGGGWGGEGGGKIAHDQLRTSEKH